MKAVIFIALVAILLVAVACQTAEPVAPDVPVEPVLTDEERVLQQYDDGLDDAFEELDVVG
ncbi:MAG: hypothetical protein ABIH34_04065 [Nanoarchaeota archaeon]